MKKPFSVRLSTEFKTLLKKEAEEQGRTLSNLIEIALIEFCRHRDLKLPSEQQRVREGTGDFLIKHKE